MTIPMVDAAFKLQCPNGTWAISHNNRVSVQGRHCHNRRLWLECLDASNRTALDQSMDIRGALVGVD